MKVFTSKTQKIGKIGEDVATKFLVKRGFNIVQRNYTKPFGEIDIVAKKEDTIHFVEVKSISREMFSGTGIKTKAEENLNVRKFNKLSNTVHTYLSEKKIAKDVLWQIDLVVVELNLNNGTGKIKFFDNVNLA